LQNKEIITTSSSVKYKNRWMTVREDEIIRSDGKPGIYGVVEKNDFAVIAPIDGKYIYLVEQYRYPVQKREWEFPQGSREDAEVDPLFLAKAELREETGLIAEKIEHIGRLYSAYGFSNQGYNVFVATGLTQGENQLEQEEIGLISKKFPISRVEEMILTGIIKDAATVAVFGLLRMKNII